MTCDKTDLHKVSTWRLSTCHYFVHVYMKGSVSLCVHSTQIMNHSHLCPPPSPPLSLRLDIFLLTVRRSTARHQSLELLLQRIIESVMSSNTLVVAHNSASGREPASLDSLAPVQKEEFHTLELLRRIYVALKIQQINCDQMI